MMTHQEKYERRQDAQQNREMEENDHWDELTDDIRAKLDLALVTLSNWDLIKELKLDKIRGYCEDVINLIEREEG